VCLASQWERQFPEQLLQQMLFGIQMRVLSFPALRVCRLSHPCSSKCGQVQRHVVVGISLLTLTRGFLIRKQPARLRPQRYNADLFKVSGNSVLCFGIDWLAGGQFAVHFSPRYGCKLPAERLCAGILLFVKQMIPRQVRWAGKPVLM